MAKNCYKKMFILEVKESWKGKPSKSDVIKTVMKSSILGVITGIQKFSRKTVYTVDDGTGVLDCVMWLNESATAQKIDKIMNENAENVSDSCEVEATCQLLLNKINIYEEEPSYIHGDIICCLGILKIVKGKLLLDINYHYKANSVNTETLWIVDVLSCHQGTCEKKIHL